jgi:hypothetical protein
VSDATAPCTPSPADLLRALDLVEQAGLGAEAEGLRRLVYRELATTRYGGGRPILSLLSHPWAAEAVGLWEFRSPHPEPMYAEFTRRAVGRLEVVLMVDVPEHYDEFSASAMLDEGRGLESNVADLDAAFAALGRDMQAGVTAIDRAMEEDPL